MSSTPPPGHFADLKLVTHFQPLYSLAHRRTVGLEALLRAEHGGQPVPSLDAYRDVRDEQRHAFDLAVCAQHASSFTALPPAPRWLFLNVDPASLATPERAHALAQTLTSHGLQAPGVVLELLEHRLELNSGVQEGLQLLREAGFLLAIDELGVGHSNLDRVCQLAPDLVKFDHALLRSATRQPRSRNLLSRLVHLMHEIGAMVVEEGVETEADVLVALESGCDLVQGFYVAPPQAQPEGDAVITPRIDARWDELMVHELLKRKITRRQLEMARQSFVQTAVALLQGTPFDQAATPMLAMPDLIRCFLLDAEGRQIGRNLNARLAPTAANPRFAPLADTTGAVWSRRTYFQHAIDQPGVLYMSEPYLSMTDTRSCVTLSMAIEIDEVMHVLCADLVLARHLPGNAQ